MGVVDIRGFPLVDSMDNMILIGSVQRPQLTLAVGNQISKERWETTGAWQRWASQMIYVRNNGGHCN